tara:strand:+ start:252 stop:503 length:252 start_codon:yes stop_codon:yes gene_type:complete
MEEVRTSEEKTQMYNAMVGMITVIDNCLDDDNDFGSDLTNEEKQERVLRTSGYLEAGVALDDWGSENMTAINAAITKAKAYTP